MVVSAITATSISLSWSVASGSVARTDVLWRETDRGTESSSDSLTGTSYTIDQLESTTIYTVTVRASNVAGTTDSQLITFSTGMYSKFLCWFLCIPTFAIMSASDVSDACEAENNATESHDCSQCSETDNTAAIIGGVVAVALMLAVTVIVIVALVLRSHSGRYSISKTRQVN